MAVDLLSLLHAERRRGSHGAACRWAAVTREGAPSQHTCPSVPGQRASGTRGPSHACARRPIPLRPPLRAVTPAGGVMFARCVPRPAPGEMALQAPACRVLVLKSTASPRRVRLGAPGRREPPTLSPSDPCPSTPTASVPPAGAGQAGHQDHGARGGSSDLWEPECHCPRARLSDSGSDDRPCPSAGRPLRPPHCSSDRGEAPAAGAQARPGEPRDWGRVWGHEEKLPAKRSVQTHGTQAPRPHTGLRRTDRPPLRRGGFGLPERSARDIIQNQKFCLQPAWSRVSKTCHDGHELLSRKRGRVLLGSELNAAQIRPRGQAAAHDAREQKGQSCRTRLRSDRRPDCRSQRCTAAVPPPGVKIGAIGPRRQDEGSPVPPPPVPVRSVLSALSAGDALMDAPAEWAPLSAAPPDPPEPVGGTGRGRGREEHRRAPSRPRVRGKPRKLPKRQQKARVCGRKTRRGGAQHPAGVREPRESA